MRHSVALAFMLFPVAAMAQSLTEDAFDATWYANYRTNMLEAKGDGASTNAIARLMERDGCFTTPAQKVGAYYIIRWSARLATEQRRPILDLPAQHTNCAGIWGLVQSYEDAGKRMNDLRAAAGLSPLNGAVPSAATYMAAQGTLEWQVRACRTKELYVRARQLMQEGDYDAASSFAKDNCRYLDKGTHGFVEDCKYPPAKPGALECEPLKAVGGVADAAP